MKLHDEILRDKFKGIIFFVRKLLPPPKKGSVQNIMYYELFMVVDCTCSWPK